MANPQRTLAASFDSSDFGYVERQQEPPPAVTVVESPEINHHSLDQLVLRMRATPSTPRDVDDAYCVFEAIREQCAALCGALVRHEVERQRSRGEAASEGWSSRRNSEASLESTSSFGPTAGRLTFSRRRGPDVRNFPREPKEISWLSGVRNWKKCLEALLEALKASLVETYRSCDEGATPDLVEKLFTNKKFRSFAIQNLRESSSTRDIMAKPEFVR
jgi:hypothetical protein